ncbi:MAG: hypothetical protein IJX66_00700 [Lachnospiraceae bacterium]|nr:hypothetical protein [Lachnospiraceae bacterium]
MTNETNNNSFSYTYSAKQQEEIKNIRDKYVPREESKMEQLRRLDAGVTQKGTLFSLIIGILSALIFGVGMCCCLVWDLFIPGTIIGIIGIAGIAAAYPVYMRITEKEREKIAPEIIRLTDELLK